MTETKGDTKEGLSKLESKTSSSSLSDAILAELPLKPSPRQMKMLDEWMQGIRSGGGAFIDQRRDLAQGGYSMAARMLCLVLTLTDDDLPKDFRLRIILSPARRLFHIWIERAVELATSKGKWTVDVERPSAKANNATLTFTHAKTKRSVVARIEDHRPNRPLDIGMVLKTDYLIYEGCFLTDRDVEDIRIATTAIKDRPSCAVATRCSCNPFWNMKNNECKLCAYHAPIEKARKEAEEAELKRTGRKCLCMCVVCFPDQEFPDPAWQCMCMRCPRGPFWPYNTVSVSKPS